MQLFTPDLSSIFDFSCILVNHQKLKVDSLLKICIILLLLILHNKQIITKLL